LSVKTEKLRLPTNLWESMERNLYFNRINKTIQK